MVVQQPINLFREKVKDRIQKIGSGIRVSGYQAFRPSSGPALSLSNGAKG